MCHADPIKSMASLSALTSGINCVRPMVSEHSEESKNYLTEFLSKCFPIKLCDYSLWERLF